MASPGLISEISPSQELGFLQGPGCWGAEPWDFFSSCLQEFQAHPIYSFSCQSCLTCETTQPKVLQGFQYINTEPAYGMYHDDGTLIGLQIPRSHNKK